jgi:hypothetical protein
LIGSSISLGEKTLLASARVPFSPISTMAHPLELAEPNVIDEELIRNCITTVEEMSIPDDKKKEMKTETELHDIQVINLVIHSVHPS